MKLLLLTFFLSSPLFAASMDPDLLLYEKLNSPPLFQKRIKIGFNHIAQSAAVIPATLLMLELEAKVKGQTVAETDKRAAACALLGMLSQQVGSDVYKFTRDPKGWATDEQKTAAQAIMTKTSEATSFCSLNSPKDESPAKTLQEALDRLKEVEAIASSVP